MTSKEHEARCMALRGGVTESERALIDELARYEAGAGGVEYVAGPETLTVAVEKARTALASDAKGESREWKGPRKCGSCGLVVDLRTPQYVKVCRRCGGTIVPYDRRAAPSDALGEAQAMVREWGRERVAAVMYQQDSGHSLPEWPDATKGNRNYYLRRADLAIAALLATPLRGESAGEGTPDA